MLVIALIIAVIVTGHGSFSNLASRGIAEGAPDYFDIGGGLMAATIMGIATLVGFDAAANMAEEAKNPFRSVPRAIVGSVVAASVLGMVFVVVLTIAIRDIPQASASDSPVAMILRDQLGTVMERSLLAVIVLAFFGAGLVTLATCARMVFAMSRDGRFPAHRVMRRVNSRTHTPIPATILIAVLGIVMLVALPGDALLLLLIVGALVGAVLYAAIIVLYLAVRNRVGRQDDAFDLGRFELPVAIGALAWSAFVVFVLAAPRSAWPSVLIAFGILVGGGLYWAYLLVSHREVLEAEPGAVPLDS